jgi:cob(I)alamin adenosyltransferase
MVNLTRIYTRTGDDGSTALGDFSRTSKNDPRLVAYADVDETGACLGVALSVGQLPADMVTLLTRVQNELFDVGADLCNPVVELAASDHAPLRVAPDYVERLEAACDTYNDDLPKLRSFILNGGTPGAALLHQARTVARRAERSAWAAVGAYGDGVNILTARYLNRLSDLLFILARAANTPAHGGTGDVLWVPGGERG